MNNPMTSRQRILLRRLFTILKKKKIGFFRKKSASHCDSFQLWRCQLIKVWPDSAKYHHFGEILSILDYFLRVYFLIFGKMLNLLWQICMTIGQNFIVSNGQIFKNKLAIWSHLPPSPFPHLSISVFLVHFLWFDPTPTFVFKASKLDGLNRSCPRFKSGRDGKDTVYFRPWRSLMEGDKQLNQSNSQTCMEWCL